MFRIPKIQTFESKSQHLSEIPPGLSGCSGYQRYKLLRASHNKVRGMRWYFKVVPDTKDTNFWEQVTTFLPLTTVLTWLFRIPKIQTFESKSQREWRSNSQRRSCSGYQRYKLLRASHNCFPSDPLSLLVVPDTKDTNFWEQVTTGNKSQRILLQLFRIPKIQTFESKSQLFLPGCNRFHRCSGYQRYKLLRASHNTSTTTLQ